MDVDAWRELLTRWNADLLDAPDIVEHLSPEVVASGWLGFPGATEEEIRAAEARLGCQLPPSYRAFLQVSNGWRTLDGWEIWSTDKIDWFRVRNQEWSDIYVTGLNPAEWDGPHSVPDDEYFNYGSGPYGKGQGWERLEYLPTALEVSDIGDADILLLNPNIITPDGEWEAWNFANWSPGGTRYRSFWEMVQSLHSIFLGLK